MPIDHVKLPVADLPRSRAFYEGALAPFGFGVVYEGEVSIGFGVGSGPDEEPFAIQRSADPVTPIHVAFTAMGPEQVDAFHAAAMAAGGTDNGDPGPRAYGGYYYAAFVLDPDGHNIEAVYHGPTLGGS